MQKTSPKINSDLIRQLRSETGAPVLRVKKVLEEVDGDEAKAAKILKEEGFAKVAKRAERETSAGLISAYTHHNGRVAALVELLCETDFVARNELFVELAANLAMQVASMNPESEAELLDQAFIKNPQQIISDLIKEVIAKTGENIRLGRFHRLELGA